MLISGGLLVNVCFWVGAYTITKKVIIPVTDKVNKKVNEIKDRKKTKEQEKSEWVLFKEREAE